MLYFWRVIFTYLIAVHHLLPSFGIHVGWYVAVEFFSIVSGYLLAEHVKNNPDEGAVDFIRKRYLYFLPIIITSALLRSCVDYSYSNWTFSEFSARLFSSIPELLILNGFYATGPVNSVDWYVQCLFILSIPMYILLKKYSKITVFVIAPIFSMIVFSYLQSHFHCFQGYMYSETLGSIGMYNMARIAAGLLLGTVVHALCASTRKTDNKTYLFIQIILFLTVLIMPLSVSSKAMIGRNDFVYLLLIAIGIATSFAYTPSSVLSSFFLSKPIKFLSKISIYIYLNHHWCCIICKHEFSNFSIPLLIGYYVSITVISIALYVLISKIGKLLRHE